jgi:co-chaperonin GroES (HSP10)
MSVTQLKEPDPFKSAEKFEPIFDRVLIKREKSALERRMEKSGLVTTDQTKDTTKSSEGILIKCAPDCADEVKALVGKRILCSRYSGDEIKIGDVEFWLATDTDVFGELR